MALSKQNVCQNISVEKSAWDLLQIVSPYASNSGSVVAAVA